MSNDGERLNKTEKLLLFCFVFNKEVSSNLMGREGDRNWKEVD